jgi:ATP phosphoribosyltransferase regulatory subunit
MTNNLPAGIYAFSGEKALQLEQSRRVLIDSFIANNYQLVLPAPINFASHTPSFKFSDSSSNNTLELVADITKEVAIIDSKQDEGIHKYCYGNQIVKPFADDFYSSRNPTQIGCEIYGDESINADVEIIQNLVQSLTLLGVQNITITLSNLAIIGTMISVLELTKFRTELMHIISKRSLPDMLDFVAKHTISTKQQLIDIISGDIDAIATYDAVMSEVQILRNLQDTLRNNNISAVIDIADNTSYNYHNGLVFSAYGENSAGKNFSKAIARGGRYASPVNKKSATGFSFDLNFILS